MAATRNSTEAPESSLTEADRADIAQMIAEAVKGGSAPNPSTDDPKGPKPVTDAEWDSWSEKKREGWVRELVDHRLDELYEQDEFRRLKEKVAEVTDKKPEPEAPPSVVSKVQRWLWGDEKR